MVSAHLFLAHVCLRALGGSLLFSHFATVLKSVARERNSLAMSGTRLQYIAYDTGKRWTLVSPPSAGQVWKSSPPRAGRMTVWSCELREESVFERLSELSEQD